MVVSNVTIRTFSLTSWWKRSSTLYWTKSGDIGSTWSLLRAANQQRQWRLFSVTELWWRHRRWNITWHAQSATENE